MSILTKNEILKRIKVKQIIIKPYKPRLISSASIDLRLGKQFRVFLPIKAVYHLNKQADYRDITKLITLKDSYFLLMPGQTVHGITIESITLPNNICGWIEGKSSIGRLGLMIHNTAGFINPGFSGKQVLEITNAGPVPLALYPDTPICQVVLNTTIGEAAYQGQFKNQKTP